MSWNEVQRGNRTWWTGNPMTYDWHGELKAERFSREWYQAIDERFLEAARVSVTDQRPFDRVIPFERLAGASVLEIGCGMGLHTELMTAAGARVTAVDLSPTSIEATRKRLALRGLEATVQEADAEQLPFPDDSFDLVWSWGVIHHSARTARIVRHIGRVTRPGGEARIMVYNREGAATRMALFREYLLRGGFRRHSVEETLYRSTDGFSARFYVPDQFEDLFRAFFRDVKSELVGQDTDALPLPRQLRSLVLPLLSEPQQRRLQSQHGSMIFLTAAHPE